MQIKMLRSTVVDGVSVKIDDVVTTRGITARFLIGMKKAEIYTQQQKKSKRKKVKVEDIVVAIGSLNKDDYTEAGLPEIKALEEILQVDINAAQRDEAWKAFNT